MKFFKLLRRLFTEDTKEIVKEKVARVAKDPRVSEPVFMMLQSIKKNPAQWRVDMDIPEIDLYSDRIKNPWKYSDYTTTSVLIFDRNVGETYRAVISLKTRVWASCITAKRLRRFISLDDDLLEVVMAKHTYYPDWMNEIEARELHAALSELVYERMKKIIARQDRAEIRKAEAINRCRNDERAKERQRLVEVYKGGSNA